MTVLPSPAGSSLRIAVASDLHAFEDANNGLAPSFLCIRDAEQFASLHPIAGLVELIQQEDLAADILMCPGDLADKAHPTSLKYAWDAMARVKATLRARVLLASTGNHDVDSRFVYNAFDPKGMLQSLRPMYPMPDADEPTNDRYWSRNFVLLESDSHRIVVLNSSAFHGGAEKEINHGRVSDHTLAALSEELRLRPVKPVNILLCHHHPEQHMELKLGDYDVMANGQLLLDLLGSGNFGRWLVIHGHKHHPKLTYAGGRATSPVVLSAGSLTATLYHELGTAARNQFYLVDIPLNLIPQYGLVGRVQAWDWAPSTGWIEATPRSGLPAASGFGNRQDPAVLATSVASRFSPPKMKWDDVLNIVPSIDYLLHPDWEEFRLSLARDHKLIITEVSGAPFELGEAYE